MATRLDFLNYLGYDISVKILTRLDDPSDIARVSCVSHAWRDFVIANGLAKHLCLRMFPQLSRVDRVVESASMAKSVVAVGTSNIEWKTLNKEHRAYAFLAQGFMSFPEKEKCISGAISASSTNRFPWESIDNILEENDMVGGSASYWSSEGHSNPAVPETLTYKLVADLCVVTEIRVKPFQAYFQWDFPTYSAESVRFRMGHLMEESHPNSLGKNFVWTYTSQEFPMTQVDCLQSLKLPKPVLCIGGILQIELCGRVQRQRSNGLFYTRVAHVQVVGRPLSPAFGVVILEPSENFVLKVLSYKQPRTVPQETRQEAGRLHRRLIEWENEDGDEESEPEAERLHRLLKAWAGVGIR